MNQPPKNQNQDPYVYASLLGAFLHDQNPIQAIAGDLTRRIKVIINLNQNMKAAKTRVEQLEFRVREVEAHMNSVNPKTAGQRLDRLR